MDTFRTATRERETVSQSETTVWAAALTSVCSDGLIWLSSVDQSPIERKCRRKRKKSRSLQGQGEPRSHGADAARGEPCSHSADAARGEPSSHGADAARGEPSPGADVAKREPT